MNNELERRLRPIFEQVRIESPVCFSIAGEVVEAQPWLPHSFASPEQTLLQSLSFAVYALSYCQENGFERRDKPVLAGVNEEFLARLSSSNPTIERWEDSWQIANVEPSGAIFATRGQLFKHANPGEYVLKGAKASPPQPGLPVSIYFPKESVALQPGYYYAFGACVSGPGDDQPLVRLYFNTTSVAAPDVLRLVAESLNRYQIPFKMKFIGDQGLYFRQDPAVLYVKRSFIQIIAMLLSSRSEDLDPLLENSTPLFTRTIQKGVGFAEDPGNGNSFGLHRSTLVAQAIWNAYLSGSQDVDVRFASMRSEFDKHGISLERPYMNSVSVPDYNFPTVD